MAVTTDTTTAGTSTSPDESRAAVLTVTVFPLFILAGSILAYLAPEPFLPLGGFITYFLMVIMFSMGLTLTLPDFADVLRRPLMVGLGVVFQYLIMPLAALLVAKVMDLNPAIAVGLYLLGSVPGGTSSNVISYLCRGDVALSVTMTSVSTLLSPVMTPVWMLVLARTETEVDGVGMAWTLAQTVLIPVIGGLMLRYFFDRQVSAISPILPAVSILGIGGVVFPTVAKNGELIVASGVVVVTAVLVHNLLGYVIGYAGAKACRFPEAGCRTVSAEVSTQSAGLASAMGAKFFTPEAALPGAVAAVLHNITGAIFAAVMRAVPLKKD
ncbi:bile acid:sodium symporter family protein [Corynebacterium uterequi]|uniref:Putative Na+-dependent transporter n=1 Tax=Corynebacterium uterequi TaxID=1072256 RepID=A0A0G3HCR0_9CORY|nr:bile acid:sodium symporter family protein [Corynebacterium uterequi]AKK11126.1 putative Na+-dependent transporter [Corynebacterium uterequi]